MVTNEAIKRIFKGCGFVFFNKKMACPCKPITTQETENNIYKIKRSKKIKQKI